MAKNASSRTNTASWVESQGRWRIRVTRDGVTKAFYCSTPGRRGQAEANRQADEWLLEGCPAKVRSSLTVGAAIEQYKKYHAGLVAKKLGKPVPDPIKTRDLGNMRQPISHLENRSKEIAGKKLARLTDGDLQQILDKAAAEGLAKKTCSNIRAAFVDFAKWCRRNGLCDYEPRDLKVPGTARAKGKSIMQPEQLKALFASTQTLWKGRAENDPLLYAYRLEVLTGLRPGELMALRWQDWEGDVLHVRGSINDRGEHTSGKNENAIRDIRLFPLAAEQLKLHSLQNGRPQTGYMFAISSQRQYRNRWYAFCDHNGIQRVKPYELRHTFVSICQRLPEGLVKQLVGHSKSMDTFGVYGHAVDGYSALAAGQLSTVFSDLLG